MLLKQIKRCLKNVNGVVGVIIKDCETGKTIQINEDEIFPSASVIKLPIIWDLFKRIDREEISLDDEMPLMDSQKVGGFGILKELHSGLNLTIKDIATLMIVLSDNSATNILIDMLGMESINNSIKENGMENTVLQRKMMDSEAKEKGLDNFTTPKDVLNILEKIMDSEVMTKESKNTIIDILKKQQCNNKLPLLMPTDAVIAHKTGDLPEVEHDVGILFLKNKSIIVVVLTKDLNDNSEGIRLNNEIGKIVYEYFK